MTKNDPFHRRLEKMSTLVQMWANINSHSDHPAGLGKLLKKVQSAFNILKPEAMKTVRCGNAFGLFLKKRAHADIQLFLGGHLDTVYSVDSPFQEAVLTDANTLKGPGVTDMKGGLVVLLAALEQFEQFPEAQAVGWEIFLNPDEETGSLGSTPFFEDCAGRCQAALLFEPSFPDGSLVSARKGSANYTLISKGKKAHAGRDPSSGKHAIYPLARCVADIEHLHNPEQGTIVNVGTIKGGEALNIIPDYAECGINIRADTPLALETADEKLKQLAQQYGLTAVQQSWRPPKPLDYGTEALIQAYTRCCEALGKKIQWKTSGGVCDGNTFAAKGVPTLDTLGVRGGAIHTENEYLELSSLVEKSDLTTLFLVEIAQGKIPLPPRKR